MGMTWALECDFGMREKVDEVEMEAALVLGLGPVFVGSEIGRRGPVLFLLL